MIDLTNPAIHDVVDVKDVYCIRLGHDSWLIEEPLVEPPFMSGTIGDPGICLFRTINDAENRIEKFSSLHRNSTIVGFNLIITNGYRVLVKFDKENDNTTIYQVMTDDNKIPWFLPFIVANKLGPLALHRKYAPAQVA